MLPRSPDLHSSLWDFSLVHYARTGVADACLCLQDEHGVNVNLLLWCVWLERRGLILDAARLHSAQKRIHAWDEHYVVPLRQLRRQIKAEFGVADAGIEQVRCQIKQAELLAEKQLQSLLEVLSQTWDNVDMTNVQPRMGENLRFYLHQLSVTDAAITELLDLFGSEADPVSRSASE